jgi:hypothetical protein
MDQGVIQNLKTHYRSRLLSLLLTALDDGKEFRVNLLEALHTARYAWNSVKQTTIANCFRHCGFKIVDGTSNYAEDQPDEPVYENSTRYAKRSPKINF